MKKLHLTLVLLGLTCMIQAGDLTTKSGKVYKNFALMGAAPNGIRVFHDGGVAVLPPSEFPDEMKTEVAKIAKNIPAARKAEQQKAKMRRARQAESSKRARAEKARQKKSAALLQQEQKKEKEKQNRLKAKTGPAKTGVIKKN